MATTKKLEMPKTETPGEVWAWLFILIGGLIALGVVLSIFFGVVIIIITLIILGITAQLYSRTVEGYYSLIVLNYFTSKQRTLFQGLHPKLPWEKSQRLIDLRVDIKEVMNDTYPSKDGLMKVKYVYAIRPDFSTGNPGENIILFGSYEPNAIQQSGRALFSMLFSDHYGKTPSDDLRNKADIYKFVFESQSGKDAVTDFETEHGVKISVKLEDSDYDESLQKYRDMVSGAKSLNEAKEILVKGGMDPADAENTVRLMNLPNVNQTLYNVNVEGLQNLKNINVVGSPFGKGNTKKGGGKP